MRAKILSAVYAAWGAQHFILSANPAVVTLAAVAWIATEAVVVVGASVLAADATETVVSRCRSLRLNRHPPSGPGEKRTRAPAAAPATGQEAPAAPSQAGEPGQQEKQVGDVVSVLASVAEGN